MNNPLSRLKKMVLNRAEIGHRWYRLRSKEDLINFSCDHPDLQAEMAKPEMREAVLDEVLPQIIADVVEGKNLEQHRARYGDEFIDEILATSERLLKENGDEPGD